MSDSFAQRLAISKQSTADEETCVQELLTHTDAITQNYSADFTAAKTLVERAREEESARGIESFIQQYSLNTQEGITIMCLAESLLRIPDSATADALIHDKFKEVDWEQHIGKSDSLFVNASTWGLMLTGDITRLSEPVKNPLTSSLRKLITRLGEPVIREALKKAMGIISTQFVMGETIEAALDKSAAFTKQGYRFSYDMLGEGARSESQAQAYYDAYLHAIETLGATTPDENFFARASISVKLSALHPRYELLQQEEVLANLLPRLITLLEAAKKHRITLSIDAEEAHRLDLSLLLFETIFTHPSFRDYEGIGFVLQAYQKRALPVLDFLIALATKHNKRIPLRLVKGAYWDSEIKHAQELGLPSYPVFTRKSYTDTSYLVCAQKILQNAACFYPQFATHNALTIASIRTLAGNTPFEFQRLKGMGRDFYTDLLANIPCRIYAPVGEHKHLLPYLIRRLLENGANNAFVNIAADKNRPLEELLANPIEKAARHGGKTHPDIPLPCDIFPGRKNSAGADLGTLADLEKLQTNLSSFENQQWHTTPLISGETQEGKTRKSYTPFDPRKQIGTITEATREHALQAITTAHSAFPEWSHTPAERRAALLKKTADILQEKRDEAIALAIYEAGKTLLNAIAEHREAIDFCRYYATEARRLFSSPTPLPGPTGERNTLSLHGRGVFACISPWNFPLAIFAGQIAAALAAGNTVLAKPAEQTPLIAELMITCFHEAGIPKDVLHFLPGKGSVIGPTLTGHDHIAGVAFTGSVATAQHINRSLAKRDGPITPLIAETGGQNAMIVDSTALPEQVVDDVITSAFDSAGQRCSALRVLYLQDTIADTTLTLLCDALESYTLGNPTLPNTDIGPVIDAAAKRTLTAHIQHMKKHHILHYAGTRLEKGHFVAPHIFEIPNIDVLESEVFGPILHVIRYPASALNEVITEINSTGFGLTCGIHTRIEEKAQHICDHLHAGNAYVNRSMIGAVVGSQPFGGEGLSGTGPKAGGPHYLLGFATERTTSINTAAIGGDIDLLT